MFWNVASARERDFTAQMVWWYCAFAQLCTFERVHCLQVKTSLLSVWGYVYMKHSGLNHFKYISITLRKLRFQEIFIIGSVAAYFSFSIDDAWR